MTKTIYATAALLTICVGIVLADRSRLRRTLIELPVTAWPYGRVVGMSGVGITEAGDERPIAENRKMALAILKPLNVPVERRPS